MCTICRHPARKVIERDLLAFPSVGAVAAHHSLPFHEAAKHKARLQIRVDQARRQVEQLLLTESLSRLNLLVEKTLKIVAAAEKNDDLKLMLQAIKEAGRLTQMLHSLEVDLEPAGLFLAATHQDWPRAASPLPTEAWVQDSVRQAIRQSLQNPCTGSQFGDDLAPPQVSPPPRPHLAIRRNRAARQSPAAIIPRLPAWDEATVLATAPRTSDPPPAAAGGGANPG